MNPPYVSYNHIKSDERIREILDAPAGAFSELDHVPSDAELTYANGFYVNCTALMIDIRDSTSMSDTHTKPVLAKIFRSYSSECIAVLCGNEDCIEVSLRGDGVLAVFDTPNKVDVDGVFSTAAKLNSMIKLLNYRLTKKNYATIKVGIGLDYGRALVIKAGFNGSGVNDRIWVGDVVNHAVKLSSYGSRNSWDDPVMIDSVVQLNLNDDNKRLLTYRADKLCYSGSIVNVAMQEWFDKNCN